MLKLIERLDFAYIDCDESVLFRGGDKEKKLPIGCFAWLLKDDKTEKFVLIDTGVNDIDAVNGTKRGTSVWHRGDKGMSLKEHLLRLQINPSDIESVVITHSHYDHLSGIVSLPDTKIYITEDAFNAAIDPNNTNAKYLAEAVQFLKSQKENGAVVFTNDGDCVAEGVTVVHSKAHTSGDQLVILENDYGSYLFTGDSLFLRENIARNLPIGFGNDSDEAMRTLELCKVFKGSVMTGHDLGCVISIKEVK